MKIDLYRNVFYIIHFVFYKIIVKNKGLNNFTRPLILNDNCGKNKIIVKT